MMQAIINRLVSIKESALVKSSLQEVFCKKEVLKRFTKFTGKHLCHRLFFNKVAGLACNFIKKETLTQCFPLKFAKSLKNLFL